MGAGWCGHRKHARQRIRRKRNLVARRPTRSPGSGPAPRLIHIFKPVGPGALALTRSRLAGSPCWSAPVVVDNDDWEGPGGWLDVLDRPWLAKRFLAWQEGWTLSRARAVTCASEALVARTGELLGVPTALLPNGSSQSLRAEIAGL